MVTQDLPTWLGSVIERSGVERIETAVRLGEAKTAGEIVPVVVRRSTSLGLLPLLTACLALLICVFFKLEGLVAWDGWTAGLIYLLATSVGYGLAFIPAVQRWLLPARDQQNAVEQRALLEFYAAHLDRTERGTGILLFVSLLERRAVVLADKGIAQHCQPVIFDQVAADLINGAKSGDLSAGFVVAVERCAGILAPHFPPLAADKNELKDYLRIKE